MRNELLRYSFGEFGNYGSSLVVFDNDEMPALRMENWAYGETHAAVSTTMITPNDLIELGQQLIALGAELKEKEEKEDDSDY